VTPAPRRPWTADDKRASFNRRRDKAHAEARAAGLGWIVDIVESVELPIPGDMFVWFHAFPLVPPGDVHVRLIIGSEVHGFDREVAPWDRAPSPTAAVLLLTLDAVDQVLKGAGLSAVRVKR